MERKNWIYALRKVELSEVCRELGLPAKGLPAKGTSETMRVLVAKWVDETKDDKILVVTRGFVERFTQRSTPSHRTVSELKKLISSLTVPE